MSEAKRMSDKSARNREDMLEALADDIERYALLSARETENVLRKDEGRHSDLHIEIESGETSDNTLKTFWLKSKKEMPHVFQCFIYSSTQLIKKKCH